MLPLILSASLLAAPGDFSFFGGDKCKETQETQRKYYTTSMVGLTLLFAGMFMVKEDHLGGGFSIAMGAPLTALGFMGMYEIYKW